MRGEVRALLASPTRAKLATGKGLFVWPDRLESTHSGPTDIWKADAQRSSSAARGFMRVGCTMRLRAAIDEFDIGNPVALPSREASLVPFTIEARGRTAK